MTGCFLPRGANLQIRGVVGMRLSSLPDRTNAATCNLVRTPFTKTPKVVLTCANVLKRPDPRELLRLLLLFDISYYFDLFSRNAGDFFDKKHQIRIIMQNAVAVA